MKTNDAAVFLDRDGVLIEDRGLLTSADEIHLLPGVPGRCENSSRPGSV